MAVSALSQANALNPGADLWILSDLEKSPWIAKIDWYLNFQICRASRHQSQFLPQFLADVLENTELEKKNIPLDKSSPLMIASQEFLPNKWVVILPWSENMTAWSAQAFQIWQKLNQPSLRIFLPPGQSAGNFQTPWQTHNITPDFTVVLD